jgi:Flp pilus assembly protein TadG
MKRDVRVPFWGRGIWLDVARRGQAFVWVAVLFPFFISIVGLAIDGGVMLSARRELQNVADGAARAGATQIDETTYRASAGQTVVLDQASAQQAAAEYVASEGTGLSASVGTSPQQVVVTVRRTVPTSFLRLVGIRSMPITATADGEVRYGITQGNP